MAGSYNLAKSAANLSLLPLALLLLLLLLNSLHGVLLPVYGPVIGVNEVPTFRKEATAKHNIAVLREVHGRDMEDEDDGVLLEFVVTLDKLRLLLRFEV